ncbi:MAG: 3-deoxy-8-phosphooctulonate synthase [Desulfomonilaceae bacterium]|nr:3-deoxy-8-phosphooctulonate synthase [Desulfomonilaceae bacterium]
MSESTATPPAVDIGGHSLRSGGELFFIVGPCVIESEHLAIEIALETARIRDLTGAPMLFKSSFDKANRTSIDSFRGPGIERGLEILNEVRTRTGLPLVSDIHTPDQAPIAAEVLDVIQIPAFLSRQTDLLVAAGASGRAVNVKKGQFQAPQDMEHAIRKIRSTGNNRILVTERGTSFGYHDLVVDMRSIVRMKQFGFPIVFDATHSAQLPAAGEGCSSGDRSLVPHLARAAVAAGADGVFMEVHPSPEKALCDGPNSLFLSNLESLVINLLSIHRDARTAAVASAGSGVPAGEEAPSPPIRERLRKIKLIILDVDGVLTDGRITFGSDSLEIKSFDVRDGHGIKLAQRRGLQFALVTGRTSDIVPRRAEDLGISYVYQNIWNKRPVLDELRTALSLETDEVAVIGDDVVDIPLFREAGFSFTVPEAPLEVRREANYVTHHRGGRGAVREMIEVILKAQGKWERAMARYYA